MLELMLTVPENAEIHPAFSAHRSMLNELNTKTNMHSYRISVFARVSSCCIYSIFYNEEHDLWDENLLCHSSLCGAVFPDSPKLSHCEPSAHPFVHQHVYSWHNSHCGTSRSCRRKSGRVLCISKLTTCQRQTHKRIIWKRRWGGVQIQLLYGTRHSDRKWTPEDLHLAVHSHRPDHGDGWCAAHFPEINSLFCIDDLQRGELARKDKEDQRRAEQQCHILWTSRLWRGGVQGLHRQWQYTL